MLRRCMPYCSLSHHTATLTVVLAHQLGADDIDPTMKIQVLPHAPARRPSVSISR